MAQGSPVPCAVLDAPASLALKGQLCDAVAAGRFPEATALVRANPALADVVVDPSTGRTALHCAVLAEDAQAVRRLVRDGADPLQRTLAQESALDLAWSHFRANHDLLTGLWGPLPALTVGQLMRREKFRAGRDLFPRRGVEMELLSSMAARLQHVRCPESGTELKEVLGAAFHALTGQALPALSAVGQRPLLVEGSASGGTFDGRQGTRVDVVALHWHFEELALALAFDRFTGPPTAELVFADLMLQPMEAAMGGLRWRDRGDGLLWQKVMQAAALIPFPVASTEIPTTLQKLCGLILGQAMPPGTAAPLRPIPFAGMNAMPAFWLQDAPPKLEVRFRAMAAAAQRVDAFRAGELQKMTVESPPSFGTPWLPGPPLLPREAVALNAGRGAPPGTCSWIAFADYGDAAEQIATLSEGMARFLKAAQPREPGAFLVIGDNFYPAGVPYANHVDFWRRWAVPFLLGATSVGATTAPFKVVLGNHDRKGDADAQRIFTTSPMNPNFRWQMCGDDGKPDICYSFVMPMAPMVPSGPPAGTVHFFAIDTCAAQWSIQRGDPGIIPAFLKQKERLRRELKSSTATWKIVMGHHPLYTNGAGHHAESLCMRLPSYRTDPSSTTAYSGFDMESLFLECGVDAYFCGHEHVWQHHLAHGILHVGVGASFESHYYGGSHRVPTVDWAAVGPFGFVHTVASVDSTTGLTMLRVQYVTDGGLRVLEEVTHAKPWQPLPVV